jgi:hypothetical protein
MHTRGPSSFLVFKFCFATNLDSFYAAVSRYSSGSFSNSFLQSSEQKKYFLPANIVWNSDSCSSILIPQTGSVVICPLLWRNCSLSFHLIAKTLPFSGISQVADPIRLPPSKISSAQNARKFFPPPCTLYLPLSATSLFSSNAKLSSGGAHAARVGTAAPGRPGRAKLGSRQ